MEMEKRKGLSVNGLKGKVTGEGRNELDPEGK